MATKNQTKKNIADLAKQAASELLEAMPTLMAAAHFEKSNRIIQALEGGQNSAAKLKTAIHEDSSFGGLRGGWIQGGNYGMTLEGHMLPYILINSALDGESIGPIIAEARAFAKSATCITERYAPLAGVTVAKSVKLDNKIDLVPWADVPDSYQKTKFGPNSPDTILALKESGIFQRRAVANSAIRVRSLKRQVLFSSHKDAKTVADASASANNVRSEQIRDIVRCITALNVYAVAAIGNWTLFDRKIANGISSGGYSYHGTLFERAVQAASSKPSMLDEGFLPGLFHHFEKFESSEKDVLRVALDRLNQALRKQNIVDKAIDLGIALEVMLLHGIGENDRGELRYRSSIRGASILGGKKSERLENFKLLKAAYDLRSKAVHSGVLKKEKKRPPPEQILKHATSACASIARKLINRGSFPDWEAEYVVGGK